MTEATHIQRQMLVKDLWREYAGLPAKFTPRAMPIPDVLAKSEWSSDFERLMRNRLLQGAFRYGRLGADGKPAWDRVQRAISCLLAYDATGNLEHLVDVANMTLLEFVEGQHPKRHFASVDDGAHTTVERTHA